QMSAARQAQRSGDRLAARHAWLGAGKTALAAGAWPEAIECALNAQPATAFLDDDAEVRALVAAARQTATGTDALRLGARLIRLMPWTQRDLRQRMASELLTLTRAGTRPDLEIEAELAWLDAHWAPGHLESRLGHADHAVALALLHGYLGPELDARLWRFVMLLEAARTGEAAEELRCCESLARETGNLDHMLAVRVRECCLALLEGSYSRADQAMSEASALAERGGAPDGPLARLTYRSILALQTHDQDEVSELSAHPVLFARLPRLVLAAMAASAGQDDQARAFLAVGLREVGSMAGPRAGPALAGGALAAALLADAAAGALIADRLAPLAGTLIVVAGGVACMGPADLYLALASQAAGNAQAAYASLESGRDLARKAGAAPWLHWTAGQSARWGAHAQANAAPMFALVREGRSWLLEYDGRRVPLGQAKGFGQLARLLATPGYRVHVSQLAGIAVTMTDAPVLDRTALAEIRDRLRVIDAAQSTADRRGDADASARLADERRAIERELRQARGLGGRSRRLGSQAERLRINVTRTIRHAIEQIAAVAPMVGADLDKHVNTGTYCSYDPADILP
ncbi:MAG TPA: hypothetical protein VF834_12425, partial [Streptosporangiaceae bacterium]